MVALPSFADALNNAFSFSGDASNPGVRVPLVFTSRLRRALREDEGLADEVRQIIGPAALVDIEMHVNPSSVKFAQQKRMSKKDVRNGSVYFHFTNSQDQNNDLLTISFSGNTGNIDLRGSRAEPDRSVFALTRGTRADVELKAAQDTGALKKLLAWHNLYQLTREPMLLPNGQPNEFQISYISPLFPTYITFVGFFNSVLSFTENADKPYSRDYEVDFTVTGLEPVGDTRALARVAFPAQIDNILDNIAVLQDTSSLVTIGPNITI